MPNNPSSARNMLNTVRGPLAAPVASRPTANAAPVMDATEARVQRAYQNMGATMPVGTVENPVRMSAGGIIGNIGILNAARMGVRPSLTPEQQAYIDQYNVFENMYNTQFIPEYEKYVQQQNAWADEYNNIAKAIESGNYDRRVDKNSKKRRRALQAEGWTVVGESSKHYYWRPPKVESVFSTAAPIAPNEPTGPALPQGYTDPEQFQQAVAQEAKQGALRKDRALSAFASPQDYNLAGFAGSSTFGPPAPTEFFAKGGDVKTTKGFIRNKNGYKDGGDVDAEKEFQKGIRDTEWFKEYVQEYNEEPDLDTQDYDYRKAWAAGIRPTVRDPYDGNKLHWSSSTDDGTMLKSQDHPTAWKEYYMRATGKNPDEVGATKKDFEELLKTMTPAFKKGGDVKTLTETAPTEGGLSYRDYPAPFGLRAYEKEEGYGGEMLPKYIGWEGEIEGTGELKGSKVTEYSMEDEKGSFPTITPLLSREEIELVASGIVTPSIYKKAVQWRDMQEAKGDSAFLNPPGFKKGGEATKFDSEILEGTQLSPDEYAQASRSLIIKRAAAEDIKDFEKKISEQAEDTNISVDPSRYIRKNSKLFPFKKNLNVAGWVDRSNPDQVHIATSSDPDLLLFLKGIKADNPEMQSAFDRIATKSNLDTLAHEMTHSNQLAEAFLSDDEYERAIRLRERYRDQIKMQKPDSKRRFANPMSGSGLDERELGAYLNAYEALHPPAQTALGQKRVIPFEKTYLGSKVLPSATGILRLLEDTGAFGIISDLKDPETLKYVNKMMGREKRKPTPSTKSKK